MATNSGVGLVMAMIRARRKPYGSGLAAADIRIFDTPAFGQSAASVVLFAKTNCSAQAQALIVIVGNNGYGQAQTQIEA